MNKKYISNSTQLPNSVVDELMSSMSGNQLKCYLLIVRKTMGWHKERDSISLSQFKQFTGIKNEKTIRAACQNLVDLGLILSIEVIGKPTMYCLNFYDEPLPKNDGGEKLAPLPKIGTPPPPPKNGGGTPTKNWYPQNQLSKPTNKPTIYGNLINQDAWDLFVDYRKTKKPKEFTDSAKKIACKALKDLSHQDQIDCVEKTILNGWTGLFPEKFKSKVYENEKNIENNRKTDYRSGVDEYGRF